MMFCLRSAMVAPPMLMLVTDGSRLTLVLMDVPRRRVEQPGGGAAVRLRWLARGRVLTEGRREGWGFQRGARGAGGVTSTAFAFLADIQMRLPLRRGWAGTEWTNVSWHEGSMT